MMVYRAISRATGTSKQRIPSRAYAEPLCARTGRC